jgi:hypothetical protein
MNNLIKLPTNVPIIGRNPTINADEWVVVFSYGQKFLAKPKVPDGDQHNTTTVFLASLFDGVPLRCADALDYTTPYRPVQTPQGIGIARDNIVSPVDTTADEVPLFLMVTGGYLLVDLQEADKATYKRIIEETLGNRKEARTRQSPLGGAGA